MIEILAVLSASGAAGMRIALPLLVIGLLSNNLWSSVPILAQIPPQVVLGILTSWSLFELFGSKKLLGQRVLQLFQIMFSPFVGCMMGVTIAKILVIPTNMIWIIGIVSGLLAFVLQLVLVGWFFRLRGLPIWVVLSQDVLCIFLVILALDAPKQGGLITMILLWIAIRSSQEWRNWYLQNKTNHHRLQQPD
jgi:type IV secretory pathway TrbD component